MKQTKSIFFVRNNKQNKKAKRFFCCLTWLVIFLISDIVLSFSEKDVQYSIPIIESCKNCLQYSPIKYNFSPNSCDAKALDVYNSFE